MGLLFQFHVHLTSLKEHFHKSQLVIHKQANKIEPTEKKMFWDKCATALISMCLCRKIFVQNGAKPFDTVLKKYSKIDMICIETVFVNEIIICLNNKFRNISITLNVWTNKMWGEQETNVTFNKSYFIAKTWQFR